MTEIVINVDRDKLPKHTDKEFDEWIRFEIGDTHVMSMVNPLADDDLEAKLEEWG